MIWHSSCHVRNCIKSTKTKTLIGSPLTWTRLTHYHSHWLYYLNCWYVYVVMPKGKAKICEIFVSTVSCQTYFCFCINFERSEQSQTRDGEFNTKKSICSLRITAHAKLDHTLTRARAHGCVRGLARICYMHDTKINVEFYGDGESMRKPKPASGDSFCFFHFVSLHFISNSMRTHNYEMCVMLFRFCKPEFLDFIHTATGCGIPAWVRW